ncbi:exosortase/archaeosortase family protein [Haloferula rosea]|uniref:Archaeosortase/exosortase family protein n=1 Tax=Haloferula rosea TaxID=490093 RepID=A0A934RE49_9BACT|nr:exosortase/archaeosortase family protein [Haloferula rosea]MBK1827877.1 archaeosortase/exosortase family protein [Haloferula rosea]
MHFPISMMSMKERLHPAPRWVSVVAGVGFLITLLPVLGWYVRRAMDGSDEPLGVIALVAAVVLGALGVCGGGPNRIQLHPCRLLLGALVLGVIQNSDLVRYPLAIAMLAVAVISLSVSMKRGKAGLVALLVLSMPVMASLDFYAGYPLRVVAAEISHGLLTVAGIEVERAGVMLIDGGRLVGIDPPCAGIRMLWTASFVAAFLAARMRLGWTQTVGLMSLAVVCVVIGNGVRAALVFLPESGRVEWPESLHSAVGLVVHGGVLAALFGLASRLDARGMQDTQVRPLPWSRRAAVVVVAMLLVLGGSRVVGRHPPKAVVEGEVQWPATLDGIPLVPLQLGPMEVRFARSFPGQIARFQWGDGEVIMRRTDRATRMMHPSGDCLRAAGYRVESEPVFLDGDGRWWGASTARRDGRQWDVHERYVGSAGEASLDASAWYWKAVLHPEDGPWTATTVLMPASGSVAVLGKR